MNTDTSHSFCHSNNAIVTASCIPSLGASWRCKQTVDLRFLICSSKFHGRFVSLSRLAAAAYCRFLAFRHRHGRELRSSLLFRAWASVPGTGITVAPKPHPARCIMRSLRCTMVPCLEADMLRVCPGVWDTRPLMYPWWLNSILVILVIAS